MMRELPIVGGMFGSGHAGCGAEFALSKEPLDSIPHSVPLFVNARSAITTLIRSLQPKHVWVPSYGCASLLSAVNAGTNRPSRFYPIDDCLRIESSQWLEQVAENDLVVFIDYFGFPCGENWIAAVQLRGGRVLEDACGAWYRLFQECTADFQVTSARKFFGVTDGSVLRFRPDNEYDLPPLRSVPSEWYRLAQEALARRTSFDNGSGETNWFELYCEVEAHQPCGNFAASDDAVRAIHEGQDYASIARLRRRNFQLLMEPLAPWAVYHELPKDVVPMGFPIRVSRRATLQEWLYKRQIFPPVHWKLPESVPRDYLASWQLAECELTIPCDQRLSSEQTTRVGELVRQGILQ